jgi:hypothetical protein
MLSEQLRVGYTTSPLAFATNTSALPPNPLPTNVTMHPSDTHSEGLIGDDATMGVGNSDS